jgi:rubrerythrin
MSEHGEGHSQAYERIKSKKTLGEILEVATEFERTARDFYNDLIPRVSKKIRYLVEELAEEEQEHFNMFTELSKRSDITDQIQKEVDTPASDTRFSDCIHLPDLGESPDDQAVLQYAMGREHAAMIQYTSLSESSPEGPIRDLFRFLASEETKHKQELEKIYYETIHSGGV